MESQVLVGHCYPYCPEPDRAMGFASHTDAGFLTVLMENQVPGLQVKREGVWVDVKPQLGGLIVNVGDFLEVILLTAPPYASQINIYHILTSMHFD